MQASAAGRVGNPMIISASHREQNASPRTNLAVAKRKWNQTSLTSFNWGSRDPKTDGWSLICSSSSLWNGLPVVCFGFNLAVCHALRCTHCDEAKSAGRENGCNASVGICSGQHHIS